MRHKTALLIIDVQIGMFDEHEPFYQAEKLLATLGKLIAGAREAHVPVIYIQHDGSEGHPLHPDAPGWPIHPAVVPVEGELVVHKLEPDSFQGTTLQQELEKRGITRLIIAGLQTEFCIDTTCRRAYGLGYDVTLVEDGHSTWNAEHLKAQQIIEHHNLVLGDWFATLKAADEIDFLTG